MYKNIILATELAEDSQAVADKAKAMAEQFGAKLTLVHAIEPIPAYGYPGIADLESPIIEHARKDMAAMGAKLSIPEADQRVEFGSVKAQILDIAEEIKADLIIIGSHGRHGLSRLLGSSASGVVHGANCDVFVVRSHD